MADIRTLPQVTPEAITADWLLAPNGTLDDTEELRTAVVIALLTKGRANADDVLPGFDDDRGGWWGDLDAETIWQGWPIGSRLWLLSRAKILAGTPALAEIYVVEALKPLVERRIVSRVEAALERSGTEEITGTVTLYRGPKAAVELRFETLWNAIRGE